MIRALMQKLGLDKLGEVVAEELRRVERQILGEERDVLAAMLARLDERIAGFGGKRRGRPPKAVSATAAPAPATRKPRRRKTRIAPKPGETLKDFVVKALAKAGGPVKVTTLVDLVLEAGYKTSAKRSTLVTSTYTALTDKKLFRKFGKGVFGLVAAPAASRKAAKSKGRANPIARKPGETLQVFVLRAFRKARKPMKAGEVAKRVKTLGYQTTSTPQNLLLTIYHVLADDTLFKKLGKGVYALALPTGTLASLRKRGKRAAAKKAPAAVAKGQTIEAAEQPTDVVPR